MKMSHKNAFFCIIFAIFYAASKFETYVMLPVEILLKIELILVQLR